MTRHPAELDPKISAWLDCYRPKKIPVEAWEAGAAQFVRSALRAAPPSRMETARRQATVLAQLASWGERDGLPLDLETLLDPSTVERFLQTRVGRSTPATYRYELRRLGPLLTRQAPWEPAPARIAHRAVAEPYSSDEVNALLREVSQQATDERCRTATAVLLLGLGVGADGRWIPLIRGTDVTVRGDAVLVELPDPHARRVPCRAEYANALFELAKSAGQELLVGGLAPKKRNWLSRVQRSVNVAEGTPNLSASRARSTWLVAHLHAGTRLPELCEAAGLQGVTVLSDLLAFVEPMDAASSIRMLRQA